MKKTSFQWVILTIVALFLGGITAWVSYKEIVIRHDYLLLDQYIKWMSQPASDNVVIIAIDDQSLMEQGQWPWPRQTHAELIERLTEAGVKGIAMDIIFAEPDRNNSGNDQRLASAIQNNGRVVLPVVNFKMKQNTQSLEEILPVPIIADAVNTLGQTDIEINTDGVLRGVWLQAGLGDSLWQTLGLALLQTQQNNQKNVAVNSSQYIDKNNQLITIRGVRNPKINDISPYFWTRDYYSIIPYVAPNSFQQFSYNDILDKRIPIEKLRDKWVVVGITASGINPQQYITPVEYNKGRNMLGIEYHANIVEMLLNNNGIIPLNENYVISLNGLIVFFSVLLMFTFYKKPIKTILITVGIILLFIILNLFLLNNKQLWFPIMPMVYIIMVTAFLQFIIYLKYWQIQSTLDPLTHLADRRYFDAMLEKEVERAKLEKEKISVVLIDVDFFKSYNDANGHNAGDKVLVQIAELILNYIQVPKDTAARFGGDEFAIILPNILPTQVEKVIDELIDSVRSLDIPHAGELSGKVITISAGIYSCIPDKQTSARMMFDLADAALYRAKAEGRNRYCFDSHLSSRKKSMKKINPSDQTINFL